MDLDTTRHAYAMVPIDEPMVDFVTVHQGDCLWGSADILASFAMISLVNEEDILKSLHKISRELIEVGRLFSTYISYAQMAFIERYFPNVVATIPPIVVNGPNLLDVRIPFYCAKPPMSEY